jgi:NADH:ubiquinone oxidoreductase subunit K
MLLNPFYPFTFLKISSLKATIVFLSILLIKSNLLRLKGGLIGSLFALILLSGILASSTIALGSLVYVYRLKKKSNTDDNQMQDLETVNV